MAGSITILSGGTVYDGAGAPGIPAGVLIEDGRIRTVGSVPESAEALRIDCSGLAVCPGFIDVHSHSDLQALQPDRMEKIRQGVTAEVVGNCGFSAFPAGDDRRDLYEFAGGILCGEGAWGWRTAREYYGQAARGDGNVTPFSLVGHGTLRISQAGLKQGPLDERDVAGMESRLDQCLAEGAAGFSTGLMYAPGSSAPAEELERLCRVTARRGKVYATHMRDYFGRIVEAIDEQIHLARRTGVRLQISHLLIAGRKNWPLLSQAFDHIENARAEGIDVAFDCYPYVAGSTVLTQILPQWALDGGAAAMLARFADAGQRKRIAKQTAETLAWAWTDIYISAVRTHANQPLVGRNLAEIAALRRRDPMETALDLLTEEHGAVNMITFNQSEENLRATMAHPLSIIGSDGFYVRGRPHPRLWGTFPRLLGTFVREEKLLPVEEAIRKITAAPAGRFGLKDRGRIATGYIADIVVFDPARIGSRAGYTSPEVPPEGILHVFRNGRRVQV